MPLFWKPYTSDITNLIQEMKANNPSLEDDQRRGRAIWWDRRVDRATQDAYDESRVRQQAYVYQSKLP